MNWRLGWAVALLVWAFGWGSPALAQAPPLPEATYWSRLEQSVTLLQDAIADAGQRDALLQRLTQLWAGVDAVQLGDGSVLPIDVGWLRLPAGTDEERLRERLRWAEAYIIARAEAGINLSPQELADLERILEDFQYGGAELPSFEADPNAASIFATVFQWVVLLVLVVAVVLFLVMLARNLQLEPARAQAVGEDEELPASAAEAGDLAERARLTQDYRAAIRYLYLASLLLLDERGVMHFDPTLTNAEHLSRLGQQPQLLAALRPIVNIFDHVWYGFAPADELLYQEFRARLAQLERVQA
ncbi:MAG: DUF4129 domain-containing protein [Anaerolineae bacterium]|nr:DUF4129 domain-containing protein [Anaerolineae bacterium]